MHSDAMTGTVFYSVSGTYPIVINMRNNLSPGEHVIYFAIRDNLGYRAESTLNYELSEETLPSNSKGSAAHCN